MGRQFRAVEALRQFEQGGVAARVNIAQDDARPLLDDGIKKTALRGQHAEFVSEPLVHVAQNVHVRGEARGSGRQSQNSRRRVHAMEGIASSVP